MGFAAAIKDKLSGIRMGKPDEASGAAVSTSQALALRHYLGKGLFSGFAVFFLLFIWMFLRGPDTAMKMQGLLPSQIVQIGQGSEGVSKETPSHEDSANEPPELKALANGRKIEPLVPAPMEGLYETVAGKIMPVARMSDDLTPFIAYKRPHKAVEGRPQVSFVITDYGMSAKFSESMLKNLPPEVTLVISPYVADPTKWASAARAYGHEFWLTLPMQTEERLSIDAGPKAIGAKDTIESTGKKISGILSLAPGYVGVVTTRDHALVDSDITTSPVLKQIYGRGLAIAESNTDRAAWGLSEAMENAYPYVQNNYWLGDDLRVEAIAQTLRDIEGQATRKGKVIVFLPPYPILINRIMDWSDHADANGFQLAPLSAMVAQ